MPVVGREVLGPNGERFALRGHDDWRDPLKVDWVSGDGRRFLDGTSVPATVHFEVNYKSVEPQQVDCFHRKEGRASVRGFNFEVNGRIMRECRDVQRTHRDGLVSRGVWPVDLGGISRKIGYDRADFLKLASDSETPTITEEKYEDLQDSGLDAEHTKKVFKEDLPAMMAGTFKVEGRFTS